MSAEDDIAAFLRAERLPTAFRDTLESVHRPLALWLKDRHQALGRPALIGLCGPQGSGKSTAAAALRLLLAPMGLRVAVLSIDDLYLTRARRAELARTTHPLLVTRGPPGTHDIGLGAEVIDRLLAGETVALPAFDKACDDRRPAADWPVHNGPADLVILEGWCVGARPQPPAHLAEPINALEREEDADGVWRRFVNAALADYQALFGRFDALIQLLPPSFEVVAGWRREQEAKLRDRTAGQAGAQGMSDAQIDRFVAHYERLTRHIIAEMPGRADALVALDADRAPRGVTRFALPR